MASENKRSLSQAVSEANVGRRVMHSFSSVPVLAYLLGIFTWFEIQVLTLFGFILVFVLEFDRLVLGNSFFDPLYRGYEQRTPAGYAYSVTGLFLAVNLFSPEIACVSVLLLSWGDPIVGLLGRGELKVVKPPRMLAAMFAISLTVVMSVDAVFPSAVESVLGVKNLSPGFLHNFPPIDISIPTAVAGASAATVADGVKLCLTTEGRKIPYLTTDLDKDGYILDDNITIPLYSGIVMTVASRLIGF